MKELSDEVINNLIDWKSSNIPHAIIGQRLFKMGVKNKFGKQMSRYSVSNLMRSQGLRTLPERTKPKVEIKNIELKRFDDFITEIVKRDDLSRGLKLRVLEALL